MNLHEKLQKLKCLSDLALFKWTAGQRRIAGNFIMLSDLRLNVLTCDKGKICYSSSAPILYMDKGRPMIQFRDHDVMTVMDGPRKGINVASTFLHAGENAVVTGHCEFREVDEDHCPKWLEDKIMSMGNSPIYPVAQLRLPELFRISKSPETLRPIFNSDIIKSIGGERGDSTEVLLDKFHKCLDLFGQYTDEGYVISNEYIATGGCCVAASRGITMRSGSVVHQVLLHAFKQDMSRRHWKITLTSKEDENDMDRASQ